MSIEGIIVGLLAVVIGAAWAAYGLKFFTILLPLWAFLFGLAAGAQWGQEIFGQGFFSTVLSWIIGFGFGLVPRGHLVLLVLRRDRDPAVARWATPSASA